MDLNYLYKRHQVSVMLAGAAASLSAHAAHATMARHYAAQIEAERERLGGDSDLPAAVWTDAIETRI